MPNLSLERRRNFEVVFWYIFSPSENESRFKSPAVGDHVPNNDQ